MSSRHRPAARTVSTVKPLRLGPRMPFQHRGGVIVFQHEHARAAAERQKLRRGRHAIADRGDQRDIGRLGMDQPGGGGSRAFMLRVRKAGLERPGRALAPHRGAAGFQRPERQRAVGGRIQVADLARDIEQGALGRKHLDGLFGGDTSNMADPGHASHKSIAPSTPAAPCDHGRRSMAHSSPDFCALFVWLQC